VFHRRGRAGAGHRGTLVAAKVIGIAVAGTMFSV
jgi:hypothetical protein